MADDAQRQMIRSLIAKGKTHDEIMNYVELQRAARRPAAPLESNIEQKARVVGEAVLPGVSQLQALGKAAGESTGGALADSRIQGNNAALLEDLAGKGTKPEVLAQIKKGLITNSGDSGFSSSLSKESDKAVRSVNEAEGENPTLALGAQMGSMLLPWNRTQGVIGGGGNASKAVRAGLGATDAARAAFVTGSARGQDLGQAGKQALVAAPIGAIGGGFAPKGIAAPVVGSGIGMAGERLSRLASGEDGPEETVDVGGFNIPKSLLRAGAIGAGAATVGALASKNVERIRDPKTTQGRNIGAFEEAGGKFTLDKGMEHPRIGKYAEGDFGIGQASLNAADEALPIISKKREYMNVAFGKGEAELLNKSADKRIDAAPLFTKLSELLKKEKLSDGTALPADDLATLQNFRHSIADEVDLRGGQKTWVPKDLTVEDLVKLRRKADEMGNVGRVAGKDDVAPRAVAGLLREEMIPAADPDLAAFLRQHHEGLSKLETAHGALVLRETPALDETQSLRERAQGRIGAFGMSDLKGPVREAGIRDAMDAVPEIREPIMDARAVRAREELAKNTAQVGHSASPVGIAKGLITGELDPTKSWKALRLSELLSGPVTGTAALSTNYLQEARRRERERERVLADKLKSAGGR